MLHTRWDGRNRSQTELSDAGREAEGRVRVFIGHKVRFQGVLAYDGTIRIDGEMEGEVRTGGCLIIGDGAVVTANVTAGTLLCKGTLKGEVVVAARAELQRPAVLLGSIATPILTVEEGVRLKGNVKMIGNLPNLLETPELIANESVSPSTPESEPV